MRRAFGVRAYTVGLLSAALVGAGLTAVVSSPQPAAAGVVERRMDGPLRHEPN